MHVLYVLCDARNKAMQLLTMTEREREKHLRRRLQATVRDSISYSAKNVSSVDSAAKYRMLVTVSHGNRREYHLNGSSVEVRSVEADLEIY